MNSCKCQHCGLVNFADGGACRRCGGALFASPPAAAAAATPHSGPTLGIRLAAITVVLAVVLGAWWGSLLATSAPLDPAQREIVDRAIALLEERGFSRQVSVLRRFTSFRSSDNWWNLYNDHYQAYAATNFPFEVVTLYSWFFELPRDDVERAIILLHESHHLLGGGEESALRQVWREKARLGWTAEVYGRSRVWRNTREWTQASAPELRP